MSDRPTFWEFAFHRRGNVVKTIDGQYLLLAGSDDYPDRRYDPSRWGLGMLFALGFFAQYVILSMKLRPNFVFDLMVLWGALLWLVYFIQYRRTRFEFVDADSVNLFEVSEWFTRPSATARRVKSIVISFFLLLLWLFAALNSVGFSYLRCLSSNSPRVLSIDILASDDADPVNPDTASLIYRTKQDYSLVMDITVAQTNRNAVFALDGVAVNLVTTDKPVFFLWQPVFPTRYMLIIGRDSIRDGSVLTLTCGSLHREWVFRTE